MQVEVLPLFLAASLAEEGFKSGTIRTKTSCARVFAAYLAREGIQDSREITRETLASYAAWARERTSPATGKKYRPGTVGGLLSAVRLLMTELYDAGHADALLLPPRGMAGNGGELETLLSEPEVARVLDSIDLESGLGVRDRSLLELMYGSALRAGEAARLRWEDVNLDGRLAVIRRSKFDRDRVVPLTHEAVEMLRRQALRLGSPPPSSLVFPGYRGKALSVGYINRRFKELCERIGVYRPGVTSHQLRHACATHLVSHGANLRYVQELLGHESIQTTVRYTKEQADEVQKAYRRYHPRENRLYEEAGEDYRQRVEDLEKRIREAREKTLVKRQKRGVQ